MIEMIYAEKIHPDSIIPTKANEDDLGWDIYAPDNFVLYAGEVRLIKTGIKLALPSGYGAIIKDRSSMAVRGLHVLGGVIDNGYRGEIIVMFANVTKQAQSIVQGHKIAQFILFPVVKAECIHSVVDTNTTRAEKGFGSSD